MAYTKVNWVDGVTPENATNLGKMDDGILAADTAAAAANAALPGKENKSEKGAVSGYAPLDSGQKVPLANLPALGSDLSFDGDWVAATYQDGDTVVKDGVVFMCVGGPTSTPPDASLWGTVGAPAAPANVVPIGGTIMWPSAVAVPTGWMVCDGSAIPGALTAAIAVLGANVPDMRGRAPFGVDTGLALGSNDAKASGSRGPVHKHTVVQPTISTPAINFTNPTVNSHTHGGRIDPTGTGNVGDTSPNWQKAGYTQDSGARFPTDPAAPGTSGGAAALASAPVASGGTVGPGASALIDMVAYLGLHFIVYVGT